MDSMTIKVPVAVRAKVTEKLKAKLIADLQKNIKAITLDLQNFEYQAKRALEAAQNDINQSARLRPQIEAQHEKMSATKKEFEDKLQRAQKLELGSEIGMAAMERMVEVKIGTDMDSIIGAEILIEDGKIIAFRG